MADAAGILGTLRIIVDADAKKAQSTLTTLPGMAKVAGATIAAGFAVAARGAMEMEDRAAAFQAATGASADEARHFTDQLNAMAGHSLVPLDALAQTMTLIRTDLGLSGVAADTAAAQFERWERATGQGAESVSAFDDILDAWNLTAADTQAIMDTLVAGQQEYGGSIADAQGALASLAPALQAANMDWQDGTELINLFNASGVDVTAAITGVTKALGKVKSPAELQALIKDIASTEDPFLRAQKAIDLFGAKAGPKLAQALQASDGDLSQFGFTAGEVAGKVDKAADALDSTLTSRIKLIVNQATSLLRGFGMEVGPILTAAFSAISLGKAVGLDKLLAPVFAKAGAVVGPIFGRAVAAGMAAADWVSGLAKLGWEKLGALYGGKFGVAFRVAAIAAVALIWVEVLNQYNQFIATVKSKNDEIAAEATKAIASGADAVLSALENRAGAMRQANPFQRAIQDTFQQEQMLEEMADFGRALSSQATLTGDQIARGISALDGAIAEAVARGNTSVAASLERAKADLQARWDALAPEDRASKVTSDMVSLFDDAASAVESGGQSLGSAWTNATKAMLSDAPGMADEVRKQFADTVAAVRQGFGNVKAALANPPQLISDEDREKNMLKRIDRLQANARKAKRIGDTRAQQYWERGVDAQQVRLDKFRGHSQTVSRNVSSKWQQAGKVTEQAHRRSTAVAISEANRAKSGVTSAAQSTSSQVEAAFAGHDLFGAGADLISSFTKGMISMAGAVKTTALFLTGIFATYFKSHSPPKVGPLSTIDKDGSNLIRSWIDGIDSRTNDVARAGIRTASAFRPNPRLGVAGAGAMGGQVHFHVGTLIANDEGLDELERRSENRRRLRRRGHDPAND